MKLSKPLFSLMAGSFAVMAATTPAKAQVIACPAGYAYSYGYGCVPASPAYGAIYPAPAVAYAPPVYDTFGLVFGGGHHHPHPGPRGGPQARMVMTTIIVNSSMSFPTEV